MGNRPAAAPPASATIADAAEAAKSAGLRYVSMSPPPPGIRRVRRGEGFRYLSPEGVALRRGELKRIRALAIPPAWTDVWICPSPLGHIQAMGHDARKRKQYRYHARWRAVRDETKFGQLVAFGKMLPTIRRRVRADLARARPAPREGDRGRRPIAGSHDDAHRQRGVRAHQPILRPHHAAQSSREFPGGALELHFRGKSGKDHRVRVADRRIARIVKACQDIPGYELFQYFDADGQRQSVDSADVNAYLREVSGADTTAKVFRTWAGTVEALAAMRAIKPEETAEATPWETARMLIEIVKLVAGQLGNTPAISRKCYIHPAVIESFQRGEFHERLATLARRRGSVRGLDADERLTLAFLTDSGKGRAKGKGRHAAA